LQPGRSDALVHLRPKVWHDPTLPCGR
jgi:hypothetical protein